MRQEDEAPVYPPCDEGAEHNTGGGSAPGGVSNGSIMRPGPSASHSDPGAEAKEEDDGVRPSPIA